MDRCVQTGCACPPKGPAGEVGVTRLRSVRPPGSGDRATRKAPGTSPLPAAIACFYQVEGAWSRGPSRAVGARVDMITILDLCGSFLQHSSSGDALDVTPH